MKSKKILIIVLSLIMIISSIIPIFANYIDDMMLPPSDLGNTSYSNTDFINKYIKFYIRIDTTISNNTNVKLIAYRNEGFATQDIINISITNDTLSVYYLTQPNVESYYYYILPTFTTTIESSVYYVPVYCWNICLYNSTYLPDNITLYKSTTTDSNILQQEAYEVGYLNGYNKGYEDGIPAGAGVLEDLNFVENIEMLIGKFTGDNYAQYITPIAIVLAILLVYFIFIRFLLSLIKAKGVIKVCDIVTLVACISILVVMYLPMIDFTITQHQLVEQVYSVAADVTP